MLRTSLLALVCIALVLSGIPLGLAQDDTPTVAILRYVASPLYDLTEGGILDVLQSYGFISADERATLDNRVDLEGEYINIIWGDGNGYVADSNLLVQDILGQDVDAIITQSTVLAQLAANETSLMEDPPAVLIAHVYEPDKFGLAESRCEKPAHISGSSVTPAYRAMLELVAEQFPDATTIGTLHDPSEEQGALGSSEIAEIAEEMGLEVLAESATTYADLRLAAQALVDNGAQVLVTPSDHMTTFGTPIIAGITLPERVPLVQSVSYSAFMGAVMSVGNLDDYEYGADVGIMLANYLNGDLDIATTGFSERDRYVIGINFDVAAMMGIEISDELRARAGLIFENGAFDFTDEQVGGGFAERGMEGSANVGTDGLVTGGTMDRGSMVVSLEERAEYDMAFLESLRCE